MPSDKIKGLDYQKLAAPAKKPGEKFSQRATLKPSEKQIRAKDSSDTNSLFNQKNAAEENKVPSETVFEVKKTESAEHFISEPDKVGGEANYVSGQQLKKKRKVVERDRELLSGDRWLVRNGHNLTYLGLYFFSILVLFRPYELVDSLSFLSATAYYVGAFTLAVYIPTQLYSEGNLTTFSTEVKAIAAMILITLITMPIAKSPLLAWDTFSDTYIRCVLIFIVMVNVIRSRRRLMAMIGLSLSIGVVLSYMALGMYMRGETTVEGYRVGVQIGGMFQNPNEMSLHLSMMIPLAIALGIAVKSKLMRVVYFSVAIVMLVANMVTYSRGGFLAFIASSAFLVWKLGRKNRVSVSLTAIVIGILTILLAPGNFGLRVLSIFIPGLDPVGSSSQRQELLWRSIFVTLRNPWGIGMGNFPIVSIQNLLSHNAYTQVSAELGLLGLAAYLVFIVSPYRKLGAIERTQGAKDDLDWFYYVAIGLQASFISYWVASFFASVAYYWFVYYLIAYAVAFRRIYKIENDLPAEVKPEPLWQIKTT